MIGTPSMTMKPPEIAWSRAHNFVLGLNSLQQGQSSEQPVYQGCKAIHNINTELETVIIDNHAFPLTRNETDYDNSYVCSPYTAYIRYARDELGLLKSRKLRWLMRGVIVMAAGLLRLGKINQTVSVNNWLFSTNPLPKWRDKTVKALTQKLIQSNPQHSLSIRSLNCETDGALMQNLAANGWIMLPARQVYLFLPGEQGENPPWWKRNNVQNDQRLLRKTSLTRVEPNQHQAQDFIEIERCFNQLFIEKHSAYNPQFSAEYFKFLHQQKLVEFYSYRDETGRIVASLGLFTQHDVLTAPIVGYDTHLPKSLGLYRLLMATLLKLTRERQLPLNLSSGAGHFKRQRGGQAVIEYTALYVCHLPWNQRWIQSGFAKLLNRFAADFLQKHEV